MNGYILISRSILGSEIWKKPPLYQKVWLYLLINAQFKPYKDLERGQLFTSVPDIQDACSYYVGYRKEVPTKDQIYKILDWLRTSHESNNESNNESDTNARMITTTKATHGIVVTICNFNVYQCSENYEGNNESNDERVTKATRKQQRKMSGITNINETDIRKENKENKDKNYTEYKIDTSPLNRLQSPNQTREQSPNQTTREGGNQTTKKTNIKQKTNNGTEMYFEQFYSQYPHPTERQRTLRNWNTALKHNTAEELLQAAKNYAESVKGREKQFIKTSSNFLGREKPYLDYIRVPQNSEPLKRREIIVEEIERE